MKKKRKKVSALKYSKYAKFVDERDRAAEKMLGNFRIEQSDILRKYFKRILDCVSTFLLHAQTNTKAIDQQIESILKPAVTELAALTNDLRKKAFILSLVGEAEALGRITGKSKYNVDPSIVSKHVAKDTMAGGQVRDRIALFVDRLRRDVVDALQLGLIKKEPPTDAFKRVINVFPNIKRQRIVRELSKIKESHKSPDDLDPGEVPDDDVIEEPDVNDIATGFVDDNEWSSIVDSYTDAYEPIYAGQDYIVDPEDPKWPSDEKIYASDIEHDMTEDFVKSVREGQVEAANQNGISDFMWIAILDDKTCEDCCAPRDGMTSSEIDEALDNGDLDADACEENIPPAHDNCRCRLAPMVDSGQEPVEIDTKSFDDWANS